MICRPKVFNPGTSRTNQILPSFILLSFVILFLTGPLCHAVNKKLPPDSVPCGGDMHLDAGEHGSTDVTVTGGTCFVDAGTYHYQNINIYQGGLLQFNDNGKTDLWAANILIERDGSLVAGSPAAPYGKNGTLTIHLWGKDLGTDDPGGTGVACKYPTDSTTADCGVPLTLWSSNVMSGFNPPPCKKVSELKDPNIKWYGPDDCFYQYMPLTYDGGGEQKGYFGYKVLGVSYAGKLQLFGKKGASYSNPGPQPDDSGTSWRRLDGSVSAGATTLKLDRVVDWVKGDQIVLTTTDYLPAHSEELTVQSVESDGKTITFARDGASCTTSGLCYAHNGKTYDLGSRNIPEGVGPDPDPNQKVICSSGQTRCVETRAAVGLLTRSIRIVSAGDGPDDEFPPDCSDGSHPCYFFGGHTVFRQGFQAVQIQGVEFYQMGQGGRIMHYPVHFHMARKTPQPAKLVNPPVTFVMDSSVWDSMTRWITLHATQGVTLSRNVGYESLGAGYYLEDGTETDNVLNANLGVLARAGIDNPQNPRKVPGILTNDYVDPAVFWIMNGWNHFLYNMASGAATCGMCYWFVPASNSGDSQNEYWTSYASLQQPPAPGDHGRDGITPLRTFVGNSCSTAEYSFFTVGGTQDGCAGIQDLKPIANNLKHNNPPNLVIGDSRQATKCDLEDCRVLPPCAVGGGEPNCAITSIDRYTTSFHWADNNLAAVWLRKQWYLFTNSAVTDVQNGGLTFVSGGGYTGSDEVPGYWALAHKDVFIGNTQTDNALASNAGPFNPDGLKCDTADTGFCTNAKEGVTFPLSNFSIAQRLFSIYDGPAYEQDNAYLDITKTVLKGCDQSLTGPGCSDWLATRVKGVPWDNSKANQQCYLPNAAIAWKQPNGFYYPPAFHSSGLYFGDVELRHYVIEPLFLPDGFDTNTEEAKARYCLLHRDAGGLFSNFTDIDRQTELSDDDGSVTGAVAGDTTGQKQAGPSISVNKDPFFKVPLETAECASDIPELMPQGKDCPYSQYPDLCATANTSPYEYVTTVLFPDAPGFRQSCSTPSCLGVPLYREDRNYDETKNGMVAIRMMGQETGQRSTLTVNHGRYYIDTTQPNISTKFVPNGRYYVFLLFAKPTTQQIYDIYVGPGFDFNTMLEKVRVDQEPQYPAFTPAGTFDGCVTVETKDQCTDHSCCYSSDGYLKVTLDLSDSLEEYNAAAEYACRPKDFCSWDKASKPAKCGCNPSQSSASPQECENACSQWATKDVRCPKNAQGVSECYGFAFTLPPGFSDFDQRPRPHFDCFAQDDNWNIKFAQPTKKDEGTVTCDYGTLPGPAQFCTGARRSGVFGDGSGLAGPRNQR